MNWKDLLAFSRSERNGIIVFSIIIFVIALTPFLYKTFIFSETIIDPTQFEQQILAFEKQFIINDSETSIIKEHAKNYEYDEAVSTKPEIKITPTEFNPNNLSAESWLAMGMPARIVNTIKNFEAAGGTFRFKEDLKRIYGMNEDIYYVLEPYIELPSRDSQIEKLYEYQVLSTPEHTTDLIIDINTADSLELINIRGIGPVFSSRILRYRELLGGFISTNQLLDVYGIDEERFESIKDQITIKDTMVRKININIAEFAEIVKHPYIDRSLANSIIRIRQQHGNYQKTEDVKRSHLIDDNLFALIAPYITVDN